MKLKHLTLWATCCLAWAVGPHAQEGAIDTDGDEVYDHEPDLCPHTPGSRDNNGCPINLEVVIVYGQRNSYSSVVCPNGATVSTYTGCAFFAGMSQGGGSFVLAYHNAMSGQYSGNSSVVTVTAEEEEEYTDEVDWGDDTDNNGVPDELDPLGVEEGPQPVPQDESYVARDMCVFDLGILRGVIPVYVNTCSMCIYGTHGRNRTKVSFNCDASAPEPHCLVVHHPEDTFVGRRTGRFECDVVWPPGSEVNR